MGGENILDRREGEREKEGGGGGWKSANENENPRTKVMGKNQNPRIPKKSTLRRWNAPNFDFLPTWQ